MFGFLIYFASCLDHSLIEDPQMSEAEVVGYPNVDEALWPYFKSFEEAALSLGHEIDLNAHFITGHIADIDKGNVAGMCSYSSRRSEKEIVLDEDFWRRSNTTYKEYIVFHELGHCVLQRDHLDACLNNKTWTSIMRSGLGDCFDNYTSRTRTYYIDELFNELSRP